MKNNHYINLLLLLGIIIVGMVSLIIGRADFYFWDAFSNNSNSEAAKLILLELRLPRTLVALIAGGALALTGAVLQAFLRNPLADSGVLGISSFAALGAVIAIYYSLTNISFWFLPLLAISFAIISILLLLFMTRRDNSTIVLILSGVVLSSLSTGLLSLLMTLAPNPYAVSEIYDWQVGSFANVSLREIFISLPFLIIGIIMLFSTQKQIDALIFGEDTAHSLGLDLNKLKLKITIAVGMIVGAITAICGVLGFVGLIVPHMIRPFVDNQPSRTYWPSFLFGALFTLAADILVRVLWFENELKLGVIMNLLGAPFFFALLLKLKKSGGQK